MAEVAKVNTTILDTKTEATNESFGQVGMHARKEDEETSIDGGFIKIEKEPSDAKTEFCSTETPPSKEEEEPTVIERSSNKSPETINLPKAMEKIEKLEQELGRVAKLLKHSESENTRLNDEIALAMETFEGSGKKFEDLELNHKKLQDQIAGADERRGVELCSLQDALVSKESKLMELINIRDSFDLLSLELESSKKKTGEFEQELQRSMDEARKFEELHKKSHSHAETESQRALELEKLLESAKKNAKEVEDQMGSLQDELKRLYDKISENQTVEEELVKTKAELSLKDSIVDELSRELDLKKASESNSREDFSGLEHLFNATREELQGKSSELDDLKLKLQDEVRAREAVKVSSEEEVLRLMKEKEALQATVDNLTSNTTHMKVLCSDLETKLKSLEELYCKSEAASNAAAEEAKTRLRDVEKENLELKQQLTVVELKGMDSEREQKQLYEKIAELNATIEAVVEEKQGMNSQIKEYEAKITQLESARSELSSQNSFLDVELKNLSDKCTYHEERAGVTHQQNIELENLCQMSQSKLEHSENKVKEFELLLEAEKYRIKELEEQINTLEGKSRNAEAESQRYSDELSKLEAELDAFRTKSSNLEQVLQTANERERQLAESLAVAFSEKKMFEEGLDNSNQRLAESDNFVNLLREELNMTQEKLGRTESDLELARTKEIEGAEKLRAYEEQVAEAAERSAFLKEELDQNLVKVNSLESSNEVLERQISELGERAAESISEKEALVETNMQLKNKIQELQASLDSAFFDKEQTALLLASQLNMISELTEKHHQASELQSTTEARFVDAEKHLKDAIQRFAQRDLEAKELGEKIIVLEGKIEGYEKQIHEASASAESRGVELEETVLRVKHLEREREGLSEANLKLNQELDACQSKISGLQAELGAALREKDDTAEQLQSSKHAVEDLKQKLEGYEKQIHEASASAESRGIELEEMVLRVKHLEGEREGLSEVNLKLNQELAACQSKISGLQAELGAALREKDDTAGQLQSSKQAVEDLKQELDSETKKFQSQVESASAAASVREAELSSRVEDLVHEINDKDALNGQLQRELELAQSSIDEQRKASSLVELERDAVAKRSQVELETQKKQDVVLQEQVRDLEQKLELAHAKSKEEAEENIPVEIKSRSMEGVPMRRKKSKKTEEGKAPPATEPKTENVVVSSASSFKLIAGVAVVSIIIGIILGKRY